MKSKSIITLIFFIQFFKIFAFSESIYPKKRIAVIDFLANNIKDSYAKAVRNKIEIALYKMNIHLLERKSIEKVLFEMGKDEKCFDTECAIRKGKIVSADYIVVGDVTYAGRYIVTARVVDIKTGRIIFADSVISDDKDKILKKAEKLADKLSNSIGKKVKKKSGKQSGKRKWRASIFINGGYLLPIAYLGRKSRQGYNISLSAGFSIGNYYVGIKSGFNHLFKYDSRVYACIIPIMPNFYYSFNIRKFFISPGISFGAAYNMIFDSNKGAFEPLVNPGLNIGYRFTPTFCLYTNIDYYCIIEKSRGIQFFIFGIGAGISI